MSKAKGSGKDRSSKTTATPNQMKTEGLPNNIKATPEQIRLAQITSGDDSQEIEDKIQELMEMTSKTKDECALALHDCVNDVSNAALLLIEGSGEPGEWKMGGKKKKRQAMQTQLPSKPDFSDHHHEAPDSSRDRSRDMEAGDRGDRDFQPRRGRRNNGGPIPRLSRGRGRDRGNMGERQNEDGEDRENGVGLARNGDRGRGRGRGGQPRRGRGGSRTFRGQGQRFEKEPHIDTWTNETADKVPDGWGQTWMDDVGDDSWAGSLNETKVFTASAAKSEESTTAASPTTPDAPAMPQRLDLGRLLPKLNNDSGNSESYINQYNAQATESIKNSIGIGSDSSRQHYPSHPATAPNLMNSVTSISMATTTQTNSWAAATAAGVVGTPTSTPSQSSSQHRPKPLKSKLPPPSKIPQSAVEMPGHQNIPPLDIHFGLDDDANSFGFTVSDSVGTTTSFATSATTSTTMASSNHTAETPTMAMPVISTPSSQPTTPQEQPPRSVFQSSGYSKKEGQSTLAPSARMSPSSDLSFTQPEQKTTSMLPSQLSSQTSSHSQGPASSANEAVSSLASYAQSSGSYNMSSYKSNPATQSYSSTHTTNSQVGSYQYQPSPKSYGGSSQNQYQSGPSQYQSSQGQASQYQNSQYPSSGQNQYGGYQSSSVGSFQSNNAGSLYQNPTPASSFQQASASYHTRDSQAGSSQPGSGFQSQSAGLASPTSQAQGSYSGPAFSSASHQSSLSSSSMTTNKLGDSMSKMSLKESAMDTHSNAQFEHSSTSSTTSAGSTTSTGALATGTTTVAVSTVSPAASSNSSRGASNLSSSASTKVPPNLPPGVPLAAGMGAAGQFFMGNHPAIYPGVQQPMFGYDEMILQGRLPMAGNYYDLSQFQVPTTMPGRDAPTLASVPYSGSADSNKLARVDAQSPNPTSQSGHTPQQPGNLMPFYYFPPQVMPGTAPGFPQYPQMFPMPPVTNTASATSQFPQKNYGYSSKGYDDQTQGQDFAKTGYGGSQSQSKGTLGGRSSGTGDLGATGYGKTHPQQAFDKQGFHGNTPPPFNMPPLAAASQATPMGAPSNAYQFMPVMAHQTHTPMAMHHQIQDSTPGSSRMGGGQGSSVGKAKAYGGYWNN